MGQRRSDTLLVTLILLAVAKAVLTRWLALGPGELLAGVALEATAAIAFLGLVDVIPSRRRPMVTVLAYVGLVAVMYLNLLYILAFDQVVDPSTLQAAGQVGAVRDVIVGLLRPIHLLYVIDIPMLILWASDVASFEFPRPARSKLVGVLAALALVATGLQVGGVHRIPAAMDSIAVARAKGLGAYQLSSIIARDQEALAAVAPVSVEPSEAVAAGAAVQEKIDEIRGVETNGHVDSVESGDYPNAHVFVIQVEALQAMAYGAYFDSQEITPNLNRMVEDSWVCTNAFSQSGVGNTSDSEFAANTSLLQPVGKAAVLEYTDHEIPSLPRLLGDSGYRTFTMHGNDVEFWNRKELYASLGFQTYYDRERIGSGDQMYRGASDERFFAEAQEIITEELGRQKPLYVNLVTMSSHAPFTHVPYGRRPLQVPEQLHGTLAADWIGSISYADMALGQFLDWMRETGLYDESIVIVYGDHQAIKELDLTGADKQIVEGLLGRTYSIVDRQKVPLVIHLPGQTDGGAVDSATGIVDIAPTVADLLGVDMSQTPHLGRSVFATPADSLVITRGHFPAGTVINEHVAFMPQLGFNDGTAMRLADGGEVKPGAVEQRDFERARELSQISEQWIRSLPVRPDAGDISDAVIPKGAQRAYEE